MPKTTKSVQLTADTLASDVYKQRMRVNEWIMKWKKLDCGRHSTTVMTPAEAFEILTVERKLLYYMECAQIVMAMSDYPIVDIKI